MRIPFSAANRGRRYGSCIYSMEGDRRVQGGYGGREKGKYGRRRDRDHMPRGRGGYNNVRGLV